ECVPRDARVALQLRRIEQRDDHDLQALRLREAREHVAVAGIVARAAEHEDATRPRPALAQQRQRRFAGTIHQRVARYLVLFDREAVELPYLGSAVDPQWQVLHSGDYTDHARP